jgi:hypothetical protein
MFNMASAAPSQHFARRPYLKNTKLKSINMYKYPVAVVDYSRHYPGIFPGGTEENH